MVNVPAMTTPLPPIDTAHVRQFWARFLVSAELAASTPLPATVEPFGDSAEMADELLALILHGPKRATAASLDELRLCAAPVPVVGTKSVATDGAGRARAVMRTTDVRIGPLSSVDEAFAWDEGEGDRSRAGWLADHHRFFGRLLPSVGLIFSPEMPTVFERFEVLYQE
jgi:uncharacterized protein YhfF